MSRVRRIIVVMSAGAVAAAGCGGSPDEIGESLSKQAYVTRADATCSAMSARLAALGLPRRAEEFPAFARKAAPVIEDALARLRELEPPAELRIRVSQFQAGVGAAADRLRKAGAAAESGDAASAQRLGSEAKMHAQAASRAARRIGYRVCGRFPGL